MVAACAALLVGAQIAGAVVVADDWAEAGQYGGVTFTDNGGGSITLSFAAQGGVPTYSAGTVTADDADFDGNFTANGVKGITVDVATSGPTDTRAILTIEGTSGRAWNFRLTAGALNKVPLTYGAGWYIGAALGEAEFVQDLLDVAKVSVVVVQVDPSAHSYTISDVRLTDENFEGDPVGLLDPLQAQLALLGLDDPADLANVDTDGDGMSDLDEILAGVDPNDENSVFAAEIVAVTAGSIEISWPAVAEGVYNVLRASELGGVADTVALGLIADADGPMSYTDATAEAGPYFYSVVKQ